MGLFRPPNVQKMALKHDLPGLVQAACYYKKDETIRMEAQIALECFPDELVDLFSAQLLDIHTRSVAGKSSFRLHYGLSGLIDALVLVGEPVFEPLLAAFPTGFSMNTEFAYEDVLSRLPVADQQLRELASDHPNARLREVAANALEKRRSLH